MTGILGYVRKDSKGRVKGPKLQTPAHVRSQNRLKPSVKKMGSEELLAYLAHSARLVILVVDKKDNKVKRCIWHDTNITEITREQIGKKDDALGDDKIAEYVELKKFIVEKVCM